MTSDSGEVVDRLQPSTSVERGDEKKAPALSAVASEANTTSRSMTFVDEKSSVDQYSAPQRLTNEIPHYPERANRHGWEGRVLLTVLINVRGEVETVSITESSGHELLDRSARDSVLAWSFKPARINGIAIAETVQLPVIFRRPSSRKN